MIATLLSFPVVVGCSGCFDQTAQKTDEEKAEEEKKKGKKKSEKPKPNFELPTAQLLPFDQSEATTRKVMYVKPGHWIATRQLVKANNFDFAGELETAAVDRNRSPLDVEHTNYSISMRTPAVLAKGRTKQVETLYYLPRREGSFGSIYNLTTELHALRGGGQPELGGPIASALKDYEYYMVVLATNPSSYTFLDKLQSIAITHSDSFDESAVNRQYLVVRPKADRSVPLPSNALTWTSIAYVIWDGIDPAILTSEQQQAMVDWIHYGGQLIVSGPGSLEKLKGSFLDPYLPADATQSRHLEQSDFDELNQVWSLPEKKKTFRGITIIEEKPILGIELRKRPDGMFLAGTGELVVERRVGGGRIVSTAFPLTDLRIRYWKNVDGFVNGCLLRRPPREFGKDDLELLTVRWRDPKFTAMLNEPKLVSTIRYFSRDVGHLTKSGSAPPISEAVRPTSDSSSYPGAPGPPIRPAITAMQQGGSSAASSSFNDGSSGPRSSSGIETLQGATTLTGGELEDWHFGGYRASPLSGVGGWNDFSGAADASRSALRDAAGIKIPQAGFVLRVLVIYLIVLVPLNWLVFWLIGRVEWAWAAAPVIAIIGALTVIRLAQLDIGFARSRTEIAILELQGRYERGHLTRYTALYSSLSDTYDITFNESSAMALPFAVDVNYQRRLTVMPKELHFYSDKTRRLTDFAVQSNSTDVLHSEAMHSLEGPISLVGDETKGFSVRNESQLTIRDVGILHKFEKQLRVAYVDELPAGTTRQLKFVNAPPGRTGPEEWSKSYVMSGDAADRSDDKQTVRLYRLVSLATERLSLLEGDVRLVGWTDELIEGCDVVPRAPQATATTLVIAHLRRGQLPGPLTDVNVAADFMTFQFEDEEEASAAEINPNTDPSTKPSDPAEATSPADKPDSETKLEESPSEETTPEESPPAAVDTPE